jgi:hypothetical protein
MGNVPTYVGCGNCGWRGKRVNIVFKDVDYDEYTPTFGYCPKCGAVVYPVWWLSQQRTVAAADPASGGAGVAPPLPYPPLDSSGGG